MTKEHEKQVQYAFEAFCKTVLRNKARNLYKQEEKLERNEQSVQPDELEACHTAQTVDRYNLESQTEAKTFFVADRTITVENCILCKALGYIVPKYRDVILLSFFLDCSDVEIAGILGISASSVGRRKERGLRDLRYQIEGMKYEQFN